MSPSKIEFWKSQRSNETHQFDVPLVKKYRGAGAWDRHHHLPTFKGVNTPLNQPTTGNLGHLWIGVFTVCLFIFQEPWGFHSYFMNDDRVGLADFRGLLYTMNKWGGPQIGVPPKSSILISFSIRNHLFWDFWYLHLWKPQICWKQDDAKASFFRCLNPRCLVNYVWTKEVLSVKIVLFTLQKSGILSHFHSSNDDLQVQLHLQNWGKSCETIACHSEKGAPYPNFTSLNYIPS